MNKKTILSPVCLPVMKEPFVGVPAKKAGQVSEGKVGWLHQQNELNETLSLN